MRAEPCIDEVRIGTCHPSQERAGTPIAANATAVNPAVTCSPDDTTVSYSRASWSGDNSRVQATSLFVSPAIADTTTATLCPASTSLCTSLATFCIRGMSATDVPPNFMTILDIEALVQPDFAGHTYSWLQVDHNGFGAESKRERGCLISFCGRARD